MAVAIIVTLVVCLCFCKKKPKPEKPQQGNYTFIIQDHIIGNLIVYISIELFIYVMQFLDLVQGNVVVQYEVALPTLTPSVIVPISNVTNDSTYGKLVTSQTLSNFF